jgi:hypothetical protein
MISMNATSTLSAPARVLRVVFAMTSSSREEQWNGNTCAENYGKEQRTALAYRAPCGSAITYGWLHDRGESGPDDDPASG